MQNDIEKDKKIFMKEMNFELIIALHMECAIYNKDPIGKG